MQTVRIELTVHEGYRLREAELMFQEGKFDQSDRLMRKAGLNLTAAPSLELSIAVICGATGVRIVVTLQHSKLQVDCRPTLRAVSPPREGRGQARPGSALVWIQLCISRPPHDDQAFARKMFGR